MDLIINFYQDLRGYPDTDILLMGKMYDLEVPVNDLRWMIAILHSTRSASMSGGMMSFVAVIPKMQEAAEERDDRSFPVIDKSYVDRLNQLAKDQQQFKKQLRRMTREKKTEKEATLNERERALTAEPGWDVIQELREKIPAQHSKWILDSYITGSTKRIEDIQSRLIPAIADFEWLKKKGKIDKKLQLQKLAGLKGLEDLLDQHQEALAELRGVLIAKEEAKAEGKIIYDGKDIKIIQPLTEEGACYYGQGTRWCTAATQAENVFEEYHEEGPLFIIQPKHPKRKGKEKYQLHFETKSFMDEKDEEIDLLELFKEYPELSSLRKHTDVIPFIILEEADFSTVKQFVDKEGLSDAEAIKLFSESSDCDILNYLIDNYDVIVETETYQGNTPLMQAIICGDGTDRLKLLLKRGANTEVKGTNKRTALMLAVENDEIDSIRILLEHGANTEATDVYGYTALTLAVEESKINSLKILLENGADPEVKDKRGETALSAAVRWYAIDILKILLEHGAKVDPGVRERYPHFEDLWEKV